MGLGFDVDLGLLGFCLARALSEALPAPAMQMPRERGLSAFNCFCLAASSLDRKRSEVVVFGGKECPVAVLGFGTHCG